LPDTVTLRRQLHSLPELGFHLPQTKQAVLNALEGLDLRIITGSPKGREGAEDRRR